MSGHLIQENYPKAQASKVCSSRSNRKADSNRDVKRHLCALYDEVFAHEGHADLRVEMRILRRQQKEVIVSCGKQFRFVVDYPTTSKSSLQAPSGRRSGRQRRQQSMPRDFKLERRTSGERRAAC